FLDGARGQLLVQRRGEADVIAGLGHVASVAQRWTAGGLSAIHPAGKVPRMTRLWIRHPWLCSAVSVGTFSRRTLGFSLTGHRTWMPDSYLGAESGVTPSACALERLSAKFWRNSDTANTMT